MPRRLEFWFDYVSHNAYLAWTRLDALATRHDLEVVLAPVLFAGLLQAHGQLGPAEIRPKSEWMLRDVLRKAARLGVPIAPPASHPFNPLLALRVTISPLAGERRAALVRGLFEAVWVESRDVSEPRVVAAIADAAGLDGEALLADAATPATKALLKTRTDEAIAAGVFGVPSMRVGDALFWGFDDLPEIERYLRGDDPLRSLDLEPWRAVKPSVQRRRE